MLNKILILQIKDALLTKAIEALHLEGNYKINQCDSSEEVIARLANISPDLLIISNAVPEAEKIKIIKTKEVISKFTDILIIEDKPLTPIIEDINEWRNTKLKSLGYLADNPFE